MTSIRPQVRRSPVEIWALASTALTSETSLYILKRVLQALLTLWLASAFSFFIIQLSPGTFSISIVKIPKFHPRPLSNWKSNLVWIAPSSSSIFSG
jgi:hypothetical protein